MASGSVVLAALLLIAAGVYQLTPWKQACLRHCRSPMEFLTRYWRQGPLGPMRAGAWHGAFCLGCCWMLMGLLFVGGLMNMLWIAGLALLVLIEKLFPLGPRVSPTHRRRLDWLGRVRSRPLIVLTAKLAEISGEDAPRARAHAFDGQRARQSRAQARGRSRKKLLHRGRSGDLAAVDEGFVIALDLVEVVEIVDHDAEGLGEPLGRQVPLPVDALEPRAIAEMKAGDRVRGPGRRDGALSGNSARPAARAWRAAAAQRRAPSANRPPPPIGARRSSWARSPDLRSSRARRGIPEPAIA